MTALDELSLMAAVGKFLNQSIVFFFFYEPVALGVS